MPDKRQRRKFEQKAAKETKAHWGLGFCDGHPVGLRRLSGSPIVLDALGVWPKRRSPYQLVCNRAPSLGGIASLLSCQYAVQGNVSVSSAYRKAHACRGGRSVGLRPICGT